MIRSRLLISLPVVLLLGGCVVNPNVKLIPDTPTPTVTIETKDFINVLGPRSQEQIHFESAIILGRARVESGSIHWTLLRGFSVVLEGDVAVTEKGPDIGVFTIDLTANRDLPAGDYSLELSSKSANSGQTTAAKKRFFTIID